MANYPSLLPGQTIQRRPVGARRNDFPAMDGDAPTLSGNATYAAPDTRIDHFHTAGYTGRPTPGFGYPQIDSAPRSGNFDYPAIQGDHESTVNNGRATWLANVRRHQASQVTDAQRTIDSAKQMRTAAPPVHNSDPSQMYDESSLRMMHQNLGDEAFKARANELGFDGEGLVQRFKDPKNYMGVVSFSPAQPRIDLHQPGTNIPQMATLPDGRQVILSPGGRQVGDVVSQGEPLPERRSYSLQYQPQGGDYRQTPSDRYEAGQPLPGQIASDSPSRSEIITQATGKPASLSRVAPDTSRQNMLADNREAYGRRQMTQADPTGEIRQAQARTEALPGRLAAETQAISSSGDDIKAIRAENQQLRTQLRQYQSAGQMAQPIRVKSVNEAMALPSGTPFITPDGRRKIR